MRLASEQGLKRASGRLALMPRSVAVRAWGVWPRHHMRIGACRTRVQRGLPGFSKGVSIRILVTGSRVRGVETSVRSWRRPARRIVAGGCRHVVWVGAEAAGFVCLCPIREDRTVDVRHQIRRHPVEAPAVIPRCHKDAER